MAFVWAFASLPVIREKVNGNIECLLATPMSPAALWMGKCLAIFLPGSILSVVATIVVLLTINLVAINPAIAQFVLPAPAIVAGLFSGPLLLFAVLAFIVLFSLADNPDVAIAPSFIVGFGIMMGLPIGIAADAIDMTSWTFALWHSAGTVVVLTVVFFFSRMLTRQNIVLSSKGS
jgi:ABC-type Na+ efflux pump permease subunit